MLFSLSPYSSQNNTTPDTPPGVVDARRHGAGSSQAALSPLIIAAASLRDMSYVEYMCTTYCRGVAKKHRGDPAANTTKAWCVIALEKVAAI